MPLLSGDCIAAEQLSAEFSLESPSLTYEGDSRHSFLGVVSVLSAAMRGWDPS